MNSSLQSSKSKIEKLVQYFGQNIHQLKSASFNEAQARQQLIDPMFEALGWDVHNISMKPLYLQEVIPEGRVKTNFGKEIKDQTALFEKKETLAKDYKEYSSILDYIAEDEFKASAKEATKKPDYRFRIGGKTKFFVEAKKPFVDLSKNQDAIFQVKRYGFSGRVPVSILTDFEEFRVFDCTHKPLYEKPKLGVIGELDLRYVQYLDEFDKLYDTFSREAVAGGSLDALTKKLLQKKTGDFTLDKAFLDDLSKWREELARDIAKHPKNKKQLNDYTLNECVQRILDRLVFFRVCEDREIEVENTLLAVLQMHQSRPGVSLYSLLVQLFQQRRSLYNGLLFSPHQSEALEVDDAVLIKILQGLNYPFSPYHFNEIGVEILGSIYEKFLGKTIHLTAKTVRVEEKPEVRKAGGVYYTPQYIVNYIVDNTVGKLLYKTRSSILPLTGGDKDGTAGSLPLTGGELERGSELLLTPKQVSKLKIIDIACGSGSFLLGAFQKLIDYHVEWYHRRPKDIQIVNNVPDAYKDAEGNLRLSSRKKRDILVNNIYGVDIDRQAVEVTQMSLYLKVLEDENAETLNPQMHLALHEVYLPKLTDNIKCGNSLIGTDFGSQGELFDDETRMKINPFDWENEFPEIIKNGGFDCVIGNPPYGAELDERERIYLENKFKLGNTDTACLMMKQAHTILSKNGLLSFIVPKAFMYSSNWDKTRNYFLEQLLQIVDVSKVWKEVKLEQAIFVSKKSSSEKSLSSYVRKDESILFVGNIEKGICEKFGFLVSGVNEVEISIAKKVADVGSFLGKHTTNQRGGMFQNEVAPRGSLKVLGGKQINRYGIERNAKGYIGKTKLQDEQATIKPNSILAQNIVAHIQNPVDHIQIIATSLETEESKNYVILDTINQITIREPYSAKYFLSLLCSNLLNWYVYRFIYAKAIRTMHFDSPVTDRIPVPLLNFSNPAEKQQHDKLVAFVDTMLELHKQLAAASFDTQKEPIERQIKATDKKIDALVYQLYGLTEEEIKVVEGEK